MNFLQRGANHIYLVWDTLVKKSYFFDLHIVLFIIHFFLYFALIKVYFYD